MEFAKVKTWLVQRRIALVGLAVSGLGYVSTAAINLTPIEEILDAVVSILPSFLDLILGVLPIIIVLSIAGFIIKFWDKILNMLNLG